jgi:CheY-like chemotaxis protein
MSEKSILLVEDDYLDAINVERSLQKLRVPYPLVVARNGKEAMDMLTGNEVPVIEPFPAVIILDLNMPKMNGIEFLRKMRSNPKLKDIHVFITTTSSEELDRTSAQNLGISGYIIKPINFDGEGNRESSIDNFNLMLELLK